ncbi:MAG: hypothetical protein MUF54_13020 [Polyangiaceae bacterium]|nr:hypothetical protein [Polyangiaceae bacterium]
MPLLIGGGVALAGGFTAWWVSGSSVEHDGFVSAPPQQAPRSGFRGVVLARTF